VQEKEDKDEGKTPDESSVAIEEVKEVEP